MFNRRKFIKASALTASLAAIERTGLSAITPVDRTEYASMPIVISTWDFGVAANKAAWTVIRSGGKAIDAVEKGVMVPEADESNQSVGYGGLPDRDGKVTLDACIMDHEGNCGAVLALEHIKPHSCRKTGDG